MFFLFWLRYTVSIVFRKEFIMEEMMLFSISVFFCWVIVIFLPVYFSLATSLFRYFIGYERGKIFSCRAMAGELVQSVEDIEFYGWSFIGFSTARIWCGKFRWFIESLVVSLADGSCDYPFRSTPNGVDNDWWFTTAKTVAA